MRSPARAQTGWWNCTARTCGWNARAVNGAAIRNRTSNSSERIANRLCECGGFLKPATISFGQSLEPDTLDRAQEAALRADLVVALGSTLSVYPAASFPLLAAQRGVPYIVINRGATEHDDEPSVSLRIEADVAEVFPAAVEAALA